MIDIRIGDCRQLIHDLADESIDCCVTSPPYWGLRDYKTAPIIFDGLPDCEHEWDVANTRKQSGGTDKATVYNNVDNRIHYEVTTNFCSKCGAWRGQIGLEPTPELFIKHLLDFFDDVKPKLKAEGNVFVNLGDTYAGSGNGTNDYRTEASKSLSGKRFDYNSMFQGKQNRKYQNLPSKSLCMVPQRFAWGMIERGWILRNEIIWSKPNHMPESVTDRLTKAHEVIYHFVKQQKYYYNLDAIREPHQVQSLQRYGRSVSLGANAIQGKILQRDEQKFGYPRHAPKWFIESQNPESFGSPRARANRKHQDNIDRNPADIADEGGNPLGKNPGDVWQVTTQPYAEAHFATFPLNLVRRPILAGCPIGGTVLDPFGGSGTVGEFCRHNERNAILFELNLEYKKLIEDRCMSKIPELETFL